MRSTDVDRTLMSALSNLAGIYEPVESDIWDPAIHWQPIPVHTQPEKFDAVSRNNNKKKKDKFFIHICLHFRRKASILRFFV